LSGFALISQRGMALACLSVLLSRVFVLLSDQP
jgi:hypothetical protein